MVRAKNERSPTLLWRVIFLSSALRPLELEQLFVPYANEPKAKKISHVDNVGMQANAGVPVLKLKAIVVMGGLSMPNVPVKAEQVKAVIGNHSGAVVIGVCFMHMFEKAGWLSTVSFDCLIDANLEMFEVTK